MKRGLVLAVTLLLVAVPAWASARPRLALARVAPLTVKGSAFPPHADLVLEARSGTAVRTRHVTTTRAGRFVVVFHGLPVSRCSALIVRAVQATGTVTTLKRPPLPACLPAATS
jgi:hypothetical protein